MFNCVTVYDTSRLVNDLEIKCWNGIHIYWATMFGVPMIIICFALPLAGLILMVTTKKHAYSDWFKEYFVFVY